MLESAGPLTLKIVEVMEQITASCACTLRTELFLNLPRDRSRELGLFYLQIVEEHVGSIHT
jgi:hypothetical protein